MAAVEFFTGAVPALDSGCLAAPVRVIATDMDGTLLTESGELPDSLPALMADLVASGVLFVPASGRPWVTLHGMFQPLSAVVGADHELFYIADNGAVIARGETLLRVSEISAGSVRALLRLLSPLLDGANGGAVLGGVHAAYVDRDDAVFLREVRRYYARVEVVEDLAEVQDATVKMALYFLSEAAHSESAVRTAAQQVDASLRVVVSGRHWIDVMNEGVNKGQALAWLCAQAGVEQPSVVAFGDYFNDAEMLDVAGLAFAMAAAPEGVKVRAHYVAPGNDEEGVVRVVRALLSPMNPDAVPGLSA